MSTTAQTEANIENAKSSIGPRTEAGKAASSRNAITHGLFAMNDFIRPNEVADYAAIWKALAGELRPGGVLEFTLVDEILRATWRLRRCGQVEATMLVTLADDSDYIDDPMQNEKTARLQLSVDRARAQAHRLLHKCTAELRKLQNERPAQQQPGEPAESNEENEETNPNFAATIRTRSFDRQTPRSALCPCNSGQKFKRCCGRSAPPVLQAA